MRDFTPEEKELIVNTEININSFDITDINYIPISSVSQYVEHNIDFWDYVVSACEETRQNYKRTKNEIYFTELVRLLPNSYKVVKL